MATINVVLHSPVILIAGIESLLDVSIFTPSSIIFTSPSFASTVTPFFRVSLLFILEIEYIPLFIIVKLSLKYLKSISFRPPSIIRPSVSAKVNSEIFRAIVQKQIRIEKVFFVIMI